MPTAERTRDARRWLVPETVQTSAMDCGPAALRSLLAGHGVTASYGRLREACQTDVDGTSIDALEETAGALGLDAVQLLIPADFVLLADATVMPCLAVVTLASGLPHFVVLWRRHPGGLVQVMDPATGRRFGSSVDLTHRLYVHEQPVPAAAWTRYAHGEAFTRALVTRMRTLHIPAGRAQALIDGSQEDPGWRTLTALDAAVRHARDTYVPRRAGRAAIEKLLQRAVADPRNAAAELPAHAWSARRTDAVDEVVMRGAVLIRIAGLAAKPVDRAALPVELRAALEEPAPRPARELLAAARREGPVRVGLLAVGMAAAGAGLVGEAALLRHAVNDHSARSLWLVAAVAALLLAIELWLAIAQLAVGRRLELGLRAALARKLWRLPDRYLRSRPASDMAERAHVLHELRLLALVVGQLVATVSEVTFVAVALIVLDPGSAPLALTAVVLVVAVAWLAQFPLREREMRVREHAGALSQLALDALVGLGAIRAHGAEDALRGAFAERVEQWRDAGRASARARATATGLQALVGVALAVAIVATALPHLDDPGARLLLVFWALTIPLAAERIGLLALQYPLQRATALRLLEPLLAPEQPRADRPPAPATDPRAGVHVQLRDVDVHAAGTPVLSAVTLTIAPGEHVAFVGASGAGKSTICALLLGWATPASGQIDIDGRPLDQIGVETLRAQTAWLDPGVRLWNQSLQDNVLYGRSDADPQRLQSVLAAAELNAVAARMNGSTHGLGDNGGLLSGGEGQRVRLARALGRPDARLAILDEPFRGLDHEQRRRLTRLAREHWATATLICATHDVSDTDDYDRVIVVDRGRIIEHGAPATLRAASGSRYRALLDAEAALRADMTAAAGWRMLAIQDGRVREHPADTTTSAAPAAADRQPPDRPQPAAPPDAGQSRVRALTALYVGVQLARYGLLLGSWTLIAGHLLDADVDGSSVTAWAVLLLCTVPLATLASWLEGRIAVGVGERLKRRLLDGALALAPERARREGPARLLGRVLESDAISALAVTGGLSVLVAAIELIAALAILAIDPAGRPAAIALACWLVLTAVTAGRYLRRRRSWTEHRLTLTEQLLEAIAGQRTRLVQHPAANRDHDEHEALRAYDRASARLDRALAVLAEALPRGWLFAALTTLAITVEVTGPDTGQIAAALGASLLAFIALRRAGSGAASLAGAALAYDQMRPLVGTRTAQARLQQTVATPPAGADGTVLLVADGVRVDRGARTVLDHAKITVHHGERILLTGASGAGKSTLAAVLCGLHTPDAGRLTLHTAATARHGDPTWRGHVTGVPQYHDNHILLAPLAFNLLMGRRWPPTPEDLAEAETCCRELGLGTALDRMPAGLQQIVGETGWQLSQGERSLVYIARALLANPELLVLDESLGPLDPHTARQALRTVLTRAPTLMIISQQ
jgi:ABC-type multidrug transport system fused ATPase/permease subunit